MVYREGDFWLCAFTTDTHIQKRRLQPPPLLHCKTVARRTLSLSPHLCIHCPCLERARVRPFPRMTLLSEQASVPWLVYTESFLLCDANSLSDFWCDSIRFSFTFPPSAGKTLRNLCISFCFIVRQSAPARTGLLLLPIRTTLSRFSCELVAANFACFGDWRHS